MNHQVLFPYLIEDFFFNARPSDDMVWKRRRAAAALLFSRTRKETHIRPPVYSEEWVTRYSLTDFFRNFRMTPAAFQYLLTILNSHCQFEVPWLCGTQPVCSAKALQIGLYYFSSQLTMHEIADKFDVADSTVFIVIRRCHTALRILMPKIIKWPNSFDCTVLSEKFQDLANFPNVIGAIDSTHIRINPLKGVGNSYLNRKMFNSINLQAVVSSDRLFLNIFAGCSGRMHDARIFSFSDISRQIQAHGQCALFPDKKFHILGDPAYPFNYWLLTRYQGDNELDDMQAHYNKAHSRTRVKVENTFGLLKVRWRRLMFANVYSIPAAVNITISCCVLHNFTMLHDTFYDRIYDNELQEQPAQYPDPSRNDAELKRDLIAASMD